MRVRKLTGFVVVEEEDVLWEVQTMHEQQGQHFEGERSSVDDVVTTAQRTLSFQAAFTPIPSSLCLSPPLPPSLLPPLLPRYPSPLHLQTPLPLSTPLVALPPSFPAVPPAVHACVQSAALSSPQSDSVNPRHPNLLVNSGE
ncbi:hypothetical protein BLNAU_5180 [Blattamonas nauphoetae]|uniref:Uncharacterized protein n=1 Tax=Blattamonas nauphoetae TaxID=2049346 RepID=A0ABQ9Y893_9EUKA|nr:hypothetical protein BLNAU_5180 [Blattamonas nauphoetae]